MVVVRVQSFKGISPRTPPRYLEEGAAQVALNCPVFSGSIQPLKDPGASLLTLPKAGFPETLYRYGQDLVSDTQYWFHWTDDVDVCRGQIAGDTSEWTFYTGDGAPKATYSAIALSGSEYPSVSRRLGLPAPNNGPGATVGGTATMETTSATATLSSGDISALNATTGLDLSTTLDTDNSYFNIPLFDPITAASVASAINAQPMPVTATDISGTVVVESTVEGEDAVVYLRYTGEPSNSPAVVTLSPSDIAVIDYAYGMDFSTVADTPEDYFNIALVDGFVTAEAIANAVNAFLSGLMTATVESDSVVIERTSGGAGSSLYVKFRDKNTTTVVLRSGTGTSTPSTRTTVNTGTGTTAAAGSPETRTYVYTWIAEESGYTMESGPSPASALVDVEFGKTVTLSGFDTVPAGDYALTGRRIYRSANGVFLYVGEITESANSFVDSLEGDALGEEIPSTFWQQPPDDMAGLTNLPNGMMAAFRGRDVFFCEPYRPHAWPTTYMQTVDYPVVGLGRMDTTLAVMTTGVPYLMQGTHPASIAVVKSDLEQACVSKRSIVSFGSAVVYAAPDGLMMLSSGGSQIITEGLFNYEQWQAYFAPETIHAYQHDNQYIAFYDNGTTRGGFIYDVRSRQFILHDIYTSTAYRDLQRDKLFLALENREVKVWNAGAVKNYIWRSKKFTMPEVMSFSCAQVESETYPMTLRVYADNSLLFTKTVASRNPFRLPATVGRDWELELEGSGEVFSLSMATSMTELANG